MPLNSSFTSFYPAKSPNVCDLAYIVDAPCLIHDLKDTPSLEMPPLNTLNKWLENNQELHTQRIHRAMYGRVGLYFEALFAYLCEYGFEAGVFPYQLIARNLQVHRNKVTLGEFDFLLQNTSSQLFHVETAVKFYLLNDKAPTDETERWQHWIGPNSKDRLDLKLHRMQSHQLTLSSQHEAAEQFDALKINPANLNIRHLIKGVLFTHLSHYKKNSPLAKPQGCNIKGMHGFWLRQTELLPQVEALGLKLTPLERTSWLYGSIPMPVSDKALGSAPVPLQYLVENKNESYPEVFRLMVVSDTWTEPMNTI